MATPNFRRPYVPPISKQPTPEELARHLRLIYQALNDHDTAIVTLHQQASAKSQPPPAAAAPTMQFSSTKIMSPKPAAKKIKVP